MTEATPISKDPIEIGRGRRPMECLLTAEEKQRDSDQVHSELEIRAQKEAERDTLDAQAKAKKEASKAVDEEITELDLKIKELSTAVRTGRATRPVEVVKLYDPVKGEIMERREDTKQLMPLGRAPTAQEWDSIKAKMQPPIEVTNDPCRAPREIPGLDPELLDEIADEMEEGQALTIQVLGYRMALREGDAFTVDERRIDLMLEAAALDGVTEGAPELSKAERWAFTAGVRQGVAELAKVDDDGTPFAAPEPRPLDPDRFEELKAQARQMGAAHRTGAPEGWHGLPSLLDALGGPAVFDDTPAAQRDAIAAAYEVGRSAPIAGPGATTVSQDDGPSLTEQVELNATLVPYLARARDQAREDAPDLRRDRDNLLSGVLQLSPSLLEAGGARIMAEYHRVFDETVAAPPPADGAPKKRTRAKKS